MMMLLQAVTRMGTAAAAPRTESPAGREDGHDERLYGCVVYGVFAIGDVRDVDRV